MGKGEGKEKGGQAEAGKGRAQGVAAGAEGGGEGQGQRAAEGPGVDPFSVGDVRADVEVRRSEGRSQRESVIADILEVSGDEGEGAGRMAVEAGPGQPSAPNVPAAAMKSILPEVRRQEKGKGGRGQLEAEAAGSGDGSVSTGGRGRTGKKRIGQAGTTGAVHAKGHLAGKGGKGSGWGRQWPQPQHSFRQPPPRSPPGVSAAVRVEEEREARRQQAARYEGPAPVESPPPRQYAPPSVRRRPGTVAGWAAGDVAELARYVKWAGKTRGRRDKRGPRPFSDLVGRAGRPGERGPEMEEWRWRRMLGAALPGVRLDCPQEKGKKPRVQMLRELLQREGRYGGDA